ncbi:hypothetical protein [Candidatus Deianiraea vastatrix]|uniref:Uncharacterized protein n=1 Tax=Candidatus Deianiraea vastatrix TaxID=2163644 RepID=A0A5B8XGW5_9RICK|nr:hypothetical protein [Candidatus Deianiraea vastatrix]QED23127.1 hypothetical protein Deia_00320 [Candidatus Deianiraea vastatrix]
MDNQYYDTLPYNPYYQRLTEDLKKFKGISSAKRDIVSEGMTINDITKSLIKSTIKERDFKDYDYLVDKNLDHNISRDFEDAKDKMSYQNILKHTINKIKLVLNEHGSEISITSIGIFKKTLKSLEKELASVKKNEKSDIDYEAFNAILKDARDAIEGIKNSEVRYAGSILERLLDSILNFINKSILALSLSAFGVKLIETGKIDDYVSPEMPDLSSFVNKDILYNAFVYYISNKSNFSQNTIPGSASSDIKEFIELLGIKEFIKICDHIDSQFVPKNIALNINLLALFKKVDLLHSASASALKDINNCISQNKDQFPTTLNEANNDMLNIHKLYEELHDTLDTYESKIPKSNMSDQDTKNKNLAKEIKELLKKCYNNILQYEVDTENNGIQYYKYYKYGKHVNKLLLGRDSDKISTKRSK